MKKSKTTSIKDIVQTRNIGDITEYTMKSNGLTILLQNRPGTGVITTNITYRVGARDEAAGETGLAHMLEHMLFKPTKSDLKNKIKEGRAMEFEKRTGAILNANTWKDRTTYYFSYPKQYLAEVLELEADRMTNVILTDKSLAPERNNVLSEFDMYNGMPEFALAVQLSNSAFHSHPYGHETIGFREDIEDYTAEKLERFYRNYYRPDNATLMVVGDIDEINPLKLIKKYFGDIKSPKYTIPRFNIREPKQEGLRRITIERPTATNIVALCFKHPGFPSQDWFTTSLTLDVIANGPESILHKALVDTGLATSVSGSIDPTSEESLASIYITLAPEQTHADIEIRTIELLKKIKPPLLKPLLKKAQASTLTSELFGRTNSLNIVGELTEYVAANSLETYSKTENLITSVTVKSVIECLSKRFTPSNMVIGYFIGTTSIKK